MGDPGPYDNGEVKEGPSVRVGIFSPRGFSMNFIHLHFHYHSRGSGCQLPAQTNHQICYCCVIEVHGI
jgi:hypothetical protein